MKTKTKITKRNKQNNITIQEGFTEFIREKEATNKAEPTINSYRTTMDYFYLFLEPTTSVKQITEHTIQDWIAELKQRKTNNNKPIKAISVNHHIGNIRVILYFLMDKGYLERFPIKLLTTQEPEPKAWTKEEAEKLLAKPQTNEFGEWRTHAIATTICGTGLRSGSIRNILMQDLNLYSNTLFLRHTKNNKLQILNIPPTLAKVLKTYIDEFRYEANDDDYLFPDRYNEQMTKNSLCQAFSRYAKKRGVANTSAHSGRHFFGLNFIRSGGSALALQHILGHSDLSTTKKYVALNHENVKPQFLLHNPLEQMSSNKSRKAVIKNIKR